MIFNLFTGDWEQEETVGNLAEQFGEPPFSILDAKSGRWKAKKRNWIAKGIKSEIGRVVDTYNNTTQVPQTTSVFDPYICELMYRWFCPAGGTIIDPFAGGSVRGIVASELGYSYTGIELRKEQVDANREQAETICKQIKPTWICGDSNKILDDIDNGIYDLAFTCPPYADLEVYSDLPEDISNMPYSQFLAVYESILAKTTEKVKHGGYFVLVVGEVRGKDGNYYGFVADTIKICQRIGLDFYNEAILATPLGSAPYRCAQFAKSKKLVKVHQNILVFRVP